MGGMVLVREVAADDWAVLRDVRLTALSEAPYAFGSTYAREVSFTQAQWRARIHERSVTFFALAGQSGPGAPAGSGTDPSKPGAGEPAGLAGVHVEDGAADLVSMWVRPACRGHGVGEALVAASASWAKAHGHDSLFLWVTESNTPARRLYARCGFTPTGERQPLPSDASLPEIRLSRAL